MRPGEITPQERLYREQTATSGRMFQEARRYLPGGDSRSTLFYPPYPAVFDRGQGCTLIDVDGNRLLDCTGNHSSLIHGYGHPHVLKAVQDQLEKGTAFPGPTAPQFRLAQMLRERLPSMELMRFTNSGTEAVINTLRGVRAFTGRRSIARVEGSYHGVLEETMVNEHPETVVLPFNDPESASSLIERERGRLAAVLVEPVQGSAGMLPADLTYLQALRDVTKHYGIMLVFDEVVSMRVAYGGSQQHYGVKPDITCLGKLIGGGFPLGVFGGRADLMRLFDPSLGRPKVPHPGSFNANPVSLAAGIGTLEMLSASTIELLNRRGALVREALLKCFVAAGVPAQITGLGSLFGIHLTEGPVRTVRDAARGDSVLRHQLFLGLYTAGVLIDPRGVGTLSTVMQDGDIEQFLRTTEGVAAGLGGDSRQAVAGRGAHQSVGR